jgi:hypothetical protein
LPEYILIAPTFVNDKFRIGIPITRVYCGAMAWNIIITAPALVKCSSKIRDLC